MKAQRPELIYLMDRAFTRPSTAVFVTNFFFPHSSAVMGDGGRLYVAPDVVPVYRSMLPLATIITPNYFEVE